MGKEAFHAVSRGRHVLPFLVFFLSVYLARFLSGCATIARNDVFDVLLACLLALTLTLTLPLGGGRISSVLPQNPPGLCFLWGERREGRGGLRTLLDPPAPPRRPPKRQTAVFCLFDFFVHVFQLSHAAHWAWLSWALWASYYLVAFLLLGTWHGTRVSSSVCQR